MTRETHKHSKNPTETEAVNQTGLDGPEAPQQAAQELSAQDEAVVNANAQEPAQVEAVEPQVAASSVAAVTHSSAKPRSKNPKLPVIKVQKRWVKITGLVVGVFAVTALVISGGASQYYKNKTLPNVYVAGVKSSAKSSEQLKNQLSQQKQQLKFSFKNEDKTFEPKFEEIGFQIDVDKTVEAALRAKREQGLFTKIAFWRESSVPASVAINDTLFSQYIEANTPNLSKVPQDAQLKFDTEQGLFVVTSQADGQSADLNKIKQELYAVSSNLISRTFNVGVTKKGPAITEAKLTPLLKPANAIIGRKVVLTGLGYTYQAKPSEIAGWLTPTPQEDGTIKLAIDNSKVQSYVDSISKRIANAPVDKKVLRDEATGAEVVIQQGRDGTELEDKQALSRAVTEALKSGQDTTQTMNITTAAYQTINMNAYEKWIEVDISEQRTTAYERATPVNNFLIASGTKGHETVLGEFTIWHKVRSQTMQGGSKASGDYYSIPNVEWVSYFYKDYALHGAWWREKFGAPASHGCVNMTNADAKWIFDWAPMGTKVIVHA